MGSRCVKCVVIPLTLSHWSLEVHWKFFVQFEVCHTQVSGPVQTTCSNTLSSTRTRHFSHITVCTYPTKDSIVYVCLCTTNHITLFTSQLFDLRCFSLHMYSIHLKIVAQHKDSVGYKKIAKTLKLSCSTVAKTIQRFNRTVPLRTCLTMVDQEVECTCSASYPEVVFGK